VGIRIFLETYSDQPYEILGEFIEVDSGASSDRPELAKATELARKTGATLLVSKFDRLSRKVSLIATLMDDKKLSFKVASMPYADKFQLHIYAALAEQGREFISIRTKAALKEAKARGVQLGGLRDKTMQRNVVMKAQTDGRAEALRAIIQPLREANATLQTIADALNKAKIETARGGMWHPTSAKNMLARLEDKAA
jgi:DNA invertase Pin-like site-specific DNA recombinase